MATWLPVPRGFAIKLVYVGFDYVLAWFVAGIARESGAVRKRWPVLLATLCLPTVLIQPDRLPFSQRSTAVPIHSTMTPPLINITLPVYNEEAQLAENAHRVLAFLAGQPASRWEILIADNGSTDRTWAIAQELAADVGSATSAAVSRRALHLDAPGRGGALKTAWLASKADILSYMDLDLSADLACLPALLAAITEGGADLAAGSRLLPPHRRRGAGGARC